MLTVRKQLRVLDLDVEARPMHWIGGDYVSKEIMAVAFKVVGDRQPPRVYTIDGGAEQMLFMLAHAIEKADMVTGHFIRGYDLPLLSGMLFEHELPTLPDVLAHDTKLDLVKRAGLSSSQENLGADLGLEHPKVGMTQHDWREAARLTPAGIEAMRRRVAGDVEQHIELRERLLELGYLRPPRMWRSNGNFIPDYSG